MTDDAATGTVEPSTGAGPRDVFVSYSRADIGRAREIVAGLETVGRTVWVDWSGIAPV